MKEPRDYLDISAEAVRCFGNDGRLDADELERLIAIATRDGLIDPNEVRVLRNIIARIRPEEVDAALAEKLQRLGQRLG